MRILIILFICIPSLIFAQDDFEYWNRISFDKKVVKKVLFDFDYGIRLEDNMSVLKNQFYQGTLIYKFNKFKVTIGSRYVNESDKTAMRYFTDYKRIFKFPSGLNIKFRNRIQYEVTNEDSEEFLIRDRLVFTYKLKDKKISPYLGAEHFYDTKHQSSFFNKYRLSIGFKYLVSKKSTFKMAFVRQNDSFPRDEFEKNIILTSYQFTIK